MHIFTLIPIILFPTAVLAASIPEPGNLTARFVGSSCQSPVDECGPDEDLYCDMTTQQCVAKAENGAKCEDREQCKSGECIGAICSVVLGQPCQTTADCKGNLEYFCSPEAKTCLAAGLSEGTSCTFDGQCAYKRCLDGACKKPPGSYGSSCSSSSECNTPLVCYKDFFSNGKKCLNNDGSVGSPCSSGSDCKGTMTCDSGTCTVKKCTGAAGGCSTNDDCCSRDCTFLKFCN